MEVRLQKYLADCGIASRRKSEELILAGKVTVNGQVITELGVKVDISYNEYDPSRLRDFIDRMNIPYTIMTNSIDVNKGIVTVRNSISKQEGNVYFETFLQELVEHSKHHHD